MPGAVPEVVQSLWGCPHAWRRGASPAVELCPDLHPRSSGASLAAVGIFASLPPGSPAWRVGNCLSPPSGARPGVSAVARWEHKAATTDERMLPGVPPRPNPSRTTRDRKPGRAPIAASWPFSEMVRSKLTGSGKPIPSATGPTAPAPPSRAPSSSAAPTSRAPPPLRPEPPPPSGPQQQQQQQQQRGRLTCRGSSMRPTKSLLPEET